MLVDPSILQFHHTQLIMETITYGDRVIQKKNGETEKAYNRNLPLPQKSEEHSYLHSLRKLKKSLTKPSALFQVSDEAKEKSTLSTLLVRKKKFN